MTLSQHGTLNTILSTVYALILCAAFAFTMASISGCGSPAGPELETGRSATTIAAMCDQDGNDC